MMVNGRTEAEDMVAQEEIARLKQQRNYWIGVASAFDEHLATMRVMLMDQPPARFGGAEPILTQEERDAVEDAAGSLMSQFVRNGYQSDRKNAVTLRRLLDRMA